MQKKLLYLFCILTCLPHTFVYGTTQVTSNFKNNTDIPVVFLSYSDTNQQATEKKIIQPSQTITTHIAATSTVRYEIQPAIRPQRINMSTGSKNIVYNQNTHQFRLQAASLSRKSELYPYLADTSVMQITNATPFPITISVVIKDAGQVTPTLIPDHIKKTMLTPDAIPAQAHHQTRLPVGASYSTDDPITGVLISCSLKKYISQDLPLARVKNKYNIVHESGKIKALAF